MSLSIALLVLALAQDPFPPPSGDPGARTPAAEPARMPQDRSRWRLVDAAIVVVNEDIITVGALTRQVARRARELNVQSEEALAKVWSEVATTAVSSRLKVQAGRNMGFDEAQIDRFAREDFERWTERQGGVVGLTQFLESENLGVEEFRDYRRDLIYAELWEDSITGEGISVAARPSRDRFVRPGMLRFEYSLAGEVPGRAEAIGGHTEQIDFERLVLPFDPRDPAAQERARELATTLRRRILDGEDLARIVEQYALDKDTAGRSGLVEIASARRLYPEADAFFVSARPGDVSEPTLTDRRGRRGYVILRLNARKAAELPSLSDVEVQRKVAENCQKEIDEYRKEFARRQAEARSYIWQAPPPAESTPRKSP
jgi:hypothetical protein